MKPAASITTLVKYESRPSTSTSPEVGAGQHASNTQIQAIAPDERLLSRAASQDQLESKVVMHQTVNEKMPNEKAPSETLRFRINERGKKSVKALSSCLWFFSTCNNLLKSKNHSNDLDTKLNKLGKEFLKNKEAITETAYEFQCTCTFLKKVSNIAVELDKYSGLIDHSFIKALRGSAICLLYAEIDYNMWHRSNGTSLHSLHANLALIKSIIHSIFKSKTKYGDEYNESLFEFLLKEMESQKISHLQKNNILLLIESGNLDGALQIIYDNLGTNKFEYMSLRYIHDLIQKAISETELHPEEPISISQQKLLKLDKIVQQYNTYFTKFRFFQVLKDYIKDIIRYGIARIDVTEDNIRSIQPVIQRICNAICIIPTAQASTFFGEWSKYITANEQQLVRPNFKELDWRGLPKNMQGMVVSEEQTPIPHFLPAPSSNAFHSGVISLVPPRQPAYFAPPRAPDVQLSLPAPALEVIRPPLAIQQDPIPPAPPIQSEAERHPFLVNCVPLAHQFQPNLAVFPTPAAPGTVPVAISTQLHNLQSLSSPPALYPEWVPPNPTAPYFPMQGQDTSFPVQPDIHYPAGLLPMFSTYHGYANPALENNDESTSYEAYYEQSEACAPVKQVELQPNHESPRGVEYLSGLCDRYEAAQDVLSNTAFLIDLTESYVLIAKDISGPSESFYKHIMNVLRTIETSPVYAFERIETELQRYLSDQHNERDSQNMAFMRGYLDQLRIPVSRLISILNKQAANTSIKNW